MIDISKKIKDLRLEKNLTQKDVAKVLNIATNTLSQFENNKGRPSLEVLTAMALFFEVSLDYLVGIEDDIYSVTVSTGQLTDQLPNDEQRLLYAYRKLEKIDKDKLIDDAEYFARRSNQNSNLKNRA